MNERELAQASAEITNRDARIIELERALATALRERDEARAVIAHFKTSLAEQHNDPMQDGGR